MRERDGAKEARSALKDSKGELRRQVAAGLSRIPEAVRAANSARARALLEAQSAWREAKSLLFFAPLPTELDIWPLLEKALVAGKLVSLPRFVAQNSRYTACQVQAPAADLEPGRFGIREPTRHCPTVPLNRLDLILVPGVAFDLHGRRLGRGKGFYDQLLAAVRGTTCGVAFDEQIVREVPVESHDVYLNCILTPTRWIELSPARGL